VLLRDRLTQGYALARRHGHPVAVLFLDLDRFKPSTTVWDMRSRSLLQSVDRASWDASEARYTVSRQGGDEFVVLLSTSSTQALRRGRA